MSCSSVLSDIILSVFLTLDTQATKQIISQTDWRKAKKEKKIRKIYDEYQKPNFPREVQASKLDKYSQSTMR